MVVVVVPSRLNVTHKARIKAVMCVKNRCSFAAKENWWHRVDQGCKDLPRDLTKIHSGDELLKCLEAGIDAKSIHSIIERCERKMRALKKR